MPSRRRSIENTAFVCAMQIPDNSICHLAQVKSRHYCRHGEIASVHRMRIGPVRQLSNGHSAMAGTESAAA